jgi:light-regulated signal transduction histidine kinase (bacteriophytochrome)
VKYAFSAIKSEETIVDLESILKDVIDDLEITIQENSAEIEIGALPSLAASNVQMRQLFSNIIVNAIKYRNADVNPKIVIHASIEDTIDPHLPLKKFHKISLSDNGIGMNNAYLGKIFTIFQRLHMRSEYSGNGIGLAICKKIMENHHGKIDVASIPGKGSIFNLYFPINTV